MAVFDEDCMLWNFCDKDHDDMDISNQVPKIYDVHHVWVKTFSEQQFLKCDCLCMKGNVHCTWIYYSHESMILFLLNRIFLFVRCGYPCAHVLKVTN